MFCFIAIFFFFFTFFCLIFFSSPKKIRKKCYPLSFPILGGRDSTRALQSTPFQNTGGVVWAWRRTNGGQTEDRRKSLCLILDIVFIVHSTMYTLIYCSEFYCKKISYSSLEIFFTDHRICVNDGVSPQLTNSCHCVILSYCWCFYHS